MKTLIVGSGGREDALAWGIHRSPDSTRLRVAPGNAGSDRFGERVPIGTGDLDALARHAIDERYDLVIIGPEAPLVGGLADRLRSAGLAVFGPSAEAARLEGSKVFAKRFMERHGIPTARFRVFDETTAAVSYLQSSEAEYPLVVKADGLAAGKGVILADEPSAAVEAASGMLSGGLFGGAGKRIVVEQRLFGREASFFVLCDGKTHVELATCQDYKRALDGDRGPNTGGMGTYSPSVWLDERAREEIRRRIVAPTLRGLAADGLPYRGVLYFGLMLTEGGPSLLEYNARFGDPETQVLLPRLDGDWLSLLLGCARGELESAGPRWRDESAVCVVMASGGYPGRYDKGLPIDGLDEAGRLENVIVFHAGTDRDERGRVITTGGRVLGVTALGEHLTAARELAYEAVSRVRWQDEQHRGDIGLDAVRGESET